MDRIHLGLGANRRINDRPLALHNVEGDPHASEGGQNVGEHDHPIGAKSPPRLEGDLNGQIRILGAIAERRVFFTQVPIDLHVSTRLAHHPNGGPIQGLSPSCPEQIRHLILYGH